MATFRFEALDSKGSEKRGTLKAADSKEAITKLRNNSLFPTKVRAVAGEVTATFEDTKVEPKQGDTESGTSEFLFPEGSKCKLESGIETFKVTINISATGLASRKASDEMAGGGDIDIAFDEISEIKLGGFFRKSMAVITKSNQEFKFTGNVSRMATTLKMEIKARSENG